MILVVYLTFLRLISWVVLLVRSDVSKDAAPSVGRAAASDAAHGLHTTATPQAWDPDGRAAPEEGGSITAPTLHWLDGCTKQPRPALSRYTRRDGGPGLIGQQPDLGRRRATPLAASSRASWI
jgi:hypothetical protein